MFLNGSTPLETRVNLLRYIGKEHKRRGSCSLNLSVELPTKLQYDAYEYLCQQNLVDVQLERTESSLHGNFRLTPKGEAVYEQIQQRYQQLVEGMAEYLG